MWQLLLQWGSKLAGPWGWLLANWRVLVTIVAIAGFAGYFYVLGNRHAEARYEKKERSRLAQEALVDAEHRRQIREIEVGAEIIEEKYAKLKAQREKATAAVDQGVLNYVATVNRNATDIGPDGVRLINEAVRSGPSPAPAESQAERFTPLSGVIYFSRKRRVSDGAVGSGHGQGIQPVRGGEGEAH